MISFKKFITEEKQQEGKKLKHLTHLEDMPIYHGHEGVSTAASKLEDIHNFLMGGKSKTKISTKYDGAPSIVFGRDPENGQFFVASKSAFNKTPKINYTPEDIERNHGHAPGLVSKLKAALEELPKIAPNQGVYQGDLMYTKDDVEKGDGKYHFTPNTITYSVDRNSGEGKKIKNANLGLVVHTKYKGKNLADMEATPDVDRENFKDHPDVHNIDPKVDVSKANYDRASQREFMNHMESARRAYSNIDPNAFDLLKDNEINVEGHVNDMVRKDKKPSAQGLIDHFTNKMNAEVEKVKTPAAKQKKIEQYSQVINSFAENAPHIENIFKLHKHLQDAKNVLVNGLNQATDYEHHIGDQPTGPEGFVVKRGGHMSKLVNREVFSKMNLLGAGKMQQAKQQTNPVVFSFGRMNPPTVGHAALVDKVKEVAGKMNAPHEIVLSHSQDPEKNPLSPEQKLDHAKKFFPDANIKVATSEEPTLMHHAKRLSDAGHDHLVVVAGGDRVPEYKALLDKYNGKNYNFKKIDVVSAGERDPDAEGVEGMSASKMRHHAMANNFNEFKKGIPAHVSSNHARQLFNDVRSGMDIAIDQNTSGISLSRYAKRDDVIGDRARKEIERRERLKKTLKGRR